MGVERAYRYESRDNERPTVGASVDEYWRAVMKTAVVQICESVGYDRSKDSALESLADITIRYISLLGKTANSYANITGRTECNLFDIILSLEDLSGSGKELDLGNCVMESKTVGEIMKFVNSDSVEEIPFAQPLPEFPLIVNGRSRKLIPSFVQMGETPPSKHIPDWLPAFPDPHTYKHTPMWNERNSDPRADKIQQARQRRKAERAYFSLEQRFVSRSRLSGISHWGSVDVVNEELEKSFRGPRRDDLVNGNHVSVLEAFAPAIQAAAAVEDGFSDDGDGSERKEKRPILQFRLRAGKKLMNECLDLKLRSKGERRPVLFVRDEDRDDKRRRAEFILRQCMENPADLNQL